MCKSVKEEIILVLPNGASHNKQAAAIAPAEAPDTLFTYKSGAYLDKKYVIHDGIWGILKLEAQYFRRQAATPTW